MNPLLSLVTCARNDNYNGDFMYRLQTAINYTGKELEKSGRLDAVELVIVDWGSECPLHTALDLLPVADRFVRFIIVPPEIAAKHNGDSPFSSALSVNVGVRRCRGEYIAQTSGDVIHPQNFFDNFLEIIQSGEASSANTLYVIPSREIPMELVNEHPDIETLHQYLLTNVNALALRPIMPVLLGGAGVLLMHKDLWRESQGLDERLKWWGWSDIDLIMRIGLKHHIINISDVNSELYVLHLQHPTQSSQGKINPFVFNPLTVNEIDWGLGVSVFEEYPPVNHTVVLQDMISRKPHAVQHYINYIVKFVKAMISSKDMQSFKNARWMLRLLLATWVKSFFMRISRT